MEQRLKERLTGAAILVALIVLIVPELFHGHLSERGGKAASSSDGPPLRSYLIDLGGAHSAPMQLGAATARGLPSAPAAGTPPVPAESATPAPSAAASNAAAAGASAPGAPSAPKRAASAAGDAPPLAAHRAISLRPAAAVAKNSSRSTLSDTHTKAASDWSVQLGLYAKRANAEHMVHVAHTKGFAASLTKPDAKGRYRVRVAGLSTRSAALTLAARLRAAGLPAAAVGPR